MAHIVWLPEETSVKFPVIRLVDILSVQTN